MFKIGRTKYLQSITAALWALPWLLINFLDRASAQGKVVLAIEPIVSSDTMLNKAKPLQPFNERRLRAKTTVEIYIWSSFTAVVESLHLGHADVLYYRLKEPNQWTPGFSTDALAY